MLDHIFPDQKKLRDACERFHIGKLSLLDERYYPSDRFEGFDLMMVVELVPGAKLGYYGLLCAEEDLSNLLENHKIYLHTIGELNNNRYRQEMLDSAVVQYAA